MSAPAAAPGRRRTRVRVRVRVRGIVQGVGFRPYVYRLAAELRLAGWVLNDAEGVMIEAEGQGAAVEAFLRRLPLDAPPLALVSALEREQRTAQDEHGFEIRPSPRGAPADTPIAADGATCADCLRELLDPRDRRYRYPFINCTNCGPRFTIVRDVPYDRPATTMAGFAMCEACRREYEDPSDRRFHAQPNACPRCGPTLALSGAGTAHGEQALAGAVRALLAGRIVAVKGIGGYHLACRADDQQAVARLRARKHRDEKPFALLARDLAAAEALVELDDAARALLCSPARPIVLARRRPRAAVAAAVAPATNELGVMLPYSPLHHLLAADVARAGRGSVAVVPLVLTSGNCSDEPIVFRDEELARLGAIADEVLLHDRPIETRTDDSVARTVTVGGRSQPLLIRRSRGYVPAELTLPVPAPQPVLACGAELKSTFCLARGARAWIGHHIGDLRNYETLRSFLDGVEHFERMFAVTPQVLVHDMHPDYLSTRYASEREDVRLIAVQHHHAHLAACLAEHGAQHGAVGAIFDGTGFGSDGTVWGGELLVGDLRACRRVGMLLPVRLPGGERAIREPWRMACSWLLSAGWRLDGDGVPAIPRTLAAAVDPVRWRKVAQLASSGTAAPLTTSVGRLCDAVAALCGVRASVSYEGQAAIELEGACASEQRHAYPVELLGTGAAIVIDPREMLRCAVTDAEAGEPVGRIAARFHAGLARATAGACARAASAAAQEHVVLSGGVFQNRVLLQDVAARLDAQGLRVLVPARTPIGDGGISFGQAAVAAARLAAERAHAVPAHER